MADDKKALRELCEKFGNEKGAKLYMKGVTLERALQDENAPKDIELLKTRIANEKKLLAHDRGEIHLSQGERCALAANDRLGLNLDEHHPNKEVRRLRSELAGVFAKRDEALAENNRLEHQRRLLGNK